MAIINGRGRVGIRRPSAAATPSIVLDGLKLYLDAGKTTSYSGTGTVWTDLSGNGNNGTLVGGPTYNSANSGSIVFDGTNDYIDLGDKDIFDGFSSYSLSTWVYINAFNQYTAFFHKWGASGYSYFLGAFNDNFKVTAGENYATNTGGKVGSYGDVSNTALQTGKWYNIVYTSTINNISLYINGVLDNSIVNSWRGGNIINSTTSLKLATHYDGPTYTNCKISNSMIYNKALSASEVLQNYNATLSRFYPVVSDSDAQAFVVAAGLTSSVQANAVNTLVTSLKSAGIWTKMKAVYPFVGGSAASHKWNLKDPRDLDAAFRLTFGGTGWVHSSTGAKPNGGDYADTFLNPNNYDQNNFSFGSYLRNTGSYNCYMGSFDTYRNYLLPIGSQYYGQINSSNFAFATIGASQTTKLHLITRTTATTAGTYINGTLLFNDNITSNGKTNRNIWIGALNSSGGDKYYSTNQQAFSFIADGLNLTEITNLTNAVNSYQTALGRQV